MMRYEAEVRREQRISITWDDEMVKAVPSWTDEEVATAYADGAYESDWITEFMDVSYIEEIE